MCFQWCLKELRISQAHCYSLFLCSAVYSWSMLVVPNPCWLLLTFMEILYSTYDPNTSISSFNFTGLIPTLAAPAIPTLGPADINIASSLSGRTSC